MPVLGVVSVAAVVGAVAVAAVLVLTGPDSDAERTRADAPRDASTPFAQTAVQPVPAPGRATGPSEPVAPALRPVRIAIPAIGVDAAVGDLGIAAGGTIEVPRVPARAGWLATSPVPGQRGPAVILGHVDSRTGPAVFYRLRQLETGDRVIVTRADGRRVTFTVDGLRTYPKNAFPTQAAYGPVPGPALRLITCGGSYVKSRGGYLDNVVVFAT